ncbi:MAG: hypothetical protein HQ523_05480 [Lentisphaerae bacterium]|nr:hypothetical protein [Lentisphaerota bacterium]
MKTTLSEHTWLAPRALWATPIAGEVGMPPHRILHALAARLSEPCRLRRLGVRVVPNSYPKCGGMQVPDWPTALRARSWTGSRWQTVLEENNIRRPAHDRVRWFDLGGLESAGLLIEARDCSVDHGWTTWNLAEGGLVLEGTRPGVAWPLDRILEVGAIDTRGCPRGVEAERRPGEVRYRTRHLEVGFRLGRPGFSYLALDEQGQGHTGINLLRLQSILVESSQINPTITPLLDNTAQGPRLQPVGGPVLMGLLPFEAEGTTTVNGNLITYTIAVPSAGQRYRIRWEVQPEALRCHVERVGARPIRAWNSGVWHVCLASETAACTSLGAVTRKGEVGLMSLPVLFHAPGHGTLRVEAQGAPILWRADSWRPTHTTSWELKLGEVPQPTGDYLLTAGRHQADITFQVHHHHIPTRRGTPAVVSQAIDRCALTGLTYRADTATLSNNGNSIHAIICADDWSASTGRLGTVLPTLDAIDLLGRSLERHLDGGPSYASGHATINGDAHYMEDEYLHSGASILAAIAAYLRGAGTRAWLRRYATPIRGEIERMRARDLDGDGLIESRYRRGISGEHQWSTHWYDAISCGWKDAFSNAILYPALRQLAEELPRLGQPGLASGLSEWADAMKASYGTAFLNAKTGWLAGWRCAEDRLHDYAFLYVNGAAVCGGLIEGTQARDIIGRLWSDMEKQQLDYRFGLPGNLVPIPYSDVALILQPGVFENGALTHCQARHFLGAMYRVGMRREADGVLRALCETLADGSAFGGVGTGQEWRRRDGTPAGYEGILSDQFGVLSVALERYGLDTTLDRHA